jgi:hypothetical protein
MVATPSNKYLHGLAGPAMSRGSVGPMLPYQSDNLVTSSYTAPSIVPWYSSSPPSFAISCFVKLSPTLGAYQVIAQCPGGWSLIYDHEARRFRFTMLYMTADCVPGGYGAYGAYGEVCGDAYEVEAMLESSSLYYRDPDEWMFVWAGWYFPSVPNEVYPIGSWLFYDPDPENPGYIQYLDMVLFWKTQIVPYGGGSGGAISGSNSAFLPVDQTNDLTADVTIGGASHPELGGECHIKELSFGPAGSGYQFNWLEDEANGRLYRHSDGSPVYKLDRRYRFRGHAERHLMDFNNPTVNSLTRVI